MKISILTFYFGLLASVYCQDYGEQARRGAAIARRRNNRGPLLAFVAGGVFGAGVGVAISSRMKNAQHETDKKDLITYIQLQDEVAKQKDLQWQAEYAKVFNAYTALDKESTERDYEEFKAPDTDNDDMISRLEFNTYVRKYLSSFPELSEKDFPKFDEFDLDGDGKVSFDEWQQFLLIQKATEAKKAAKNDPSSSPVYNDLMNALYENTNNAHDFNGLNKNMANSKNTRRNAQQKALEY